MPDINTEKKIRFLPIPANESERPSWVAVVITLVLQLYPVTALLAFLRLRKMWKNHKLEKYRKYQRAVGDRDSISIKELSKITGTNSKNDTRSLVADMISRGYLGMEAYIDYSADILYLTKPGTDEKEAKKSRTITIDLDSVSGGLSEIMTGISGIAGEVASTLRSEFGAKHAQPTGHRYAPNEKSRKAEETAQPAEAPKAPETAKPAEAGQEAPAEAVVTDMTAGEAALARLKLLNDDILDEDVSRKIDRIAMITGDIYAFTTLNPERSNEVRKFMNYYLPTTMKLLTSYSMLERQSYQGENIVNARHDIEKILDTLVHAFEKQLDQLFATDAVDISSDITVLETMIAKDGLSQDTKGIKLQI